MSTRPTDRYDPDFDIVNLGTPIDAPMEPFNPLIPEQKPKAPPETPAETPAQTKAVEPPKPEKPPELPPAAVKKAPTQKPVPKMARTDMEAGIAYIREFPRPVLEVVQVMFPGMNQTDALVAFILHSLGNDASVPGYIVPDNIQVAVAKAADGAKTGMAAELTGQNKKLDAIFNQTLFLQHLAMYGMLHDLGLRKQTRDASEVDMVEDRIFELTEIAKKAFPEYKQIVMDKEKRNIAYYRAKNKKEGL